MDNRLTFRRTLLNEDSEHVRGPQVALAKQAEAAMGLGANAVFQAPTGMGKTRAMLYAGVAHILNDPNRHKSLYVAKTLPQLNHVFHEIEKYVVPACKQNGLETTIHFGIALGTKPMIDRICSAYWQEDGCDKGDISCRSCAICGQRNSPAIKVGPATLRHYKIAIESGRCPYAYMRDSLRESNFIIGTHAYVNHDYWLSRTFGSIDNLRNVSVIIDEAHNYVEELIQKPIIEITWDNQSQFSEYRQPESKISMPDMFKKFSGEISILICWNNYRNTIKSITHIDSVDFREMMAQLKTELSAAHIQHNRNVSIMRAILNIGKAWEGNWRKTESLGRTEKQQLIHIIDFSSNDFSQTIQEYEQVLREIKTKVPLTEDLAYQISEKKEAKRDYIQNWKYHKNLFDAAKEVGMLDTELIDNQNAAYHEKQAAIEIIQPQINKLYEKKQSIQDNLGDLFVKKKELKNRIYKYQEHIFKLCRLSYTRKAKLKERKTEIENFLSNLQNKLHNLDDTEEITEPLAMRLYGSSVVVATALKITPLFFRTFAQSIEPGKGKNLACLIDEELKRKISNAVYELKCISKSFGGDYIEWLSNIKQLLLVLHEMTLEPHRFFVEYKSICLGESVDISALQINDLDIGGKSHRFLGRFYNTVLTSATISPAKETSLMLDWANALCEEFLPVFPKENYCVHGFLGFHAGKSYSTEHSNNRVSKAQIDYLKTHLPYIIEKAEGNVGCFVCSESFLKEIYPVLTKEVNWGEDVKHLILSNANRNMEDDYSELATEYGLSLSKSLDFDGEWKTILKENNKSKIVVWFATTGKFSEGVDFPGKELTSAILIGIPYPNTQEILSLLNSRIEYYKRYKNEALAKLIHEVSFHIYPYRKLCQAVGRIHRKHDDRGSIVFLDERLFGFHCQRDCKGTVRIKFDKSIDHSSVRYNILPQRIREQIVLIDSAPGNVQYNKKKLNDRFPNMLLGCMKDFSKNMKLFHNNKDYKLDLRNRLKNIRLANIDYSTTREKILQVLSQKYNIVSFVLPMKDHRHTGHAYITISTQSEDKELLQSLKEISFNNRHIVAHFNMA